PGGSASENFSFLTVCFEDLISLPDCCEYPSIAMLGSSTKQTITSCDWPRTRTYSRTTFAGEAPAPLRIRTTAPPVLQLRLMWPLASSAVRSSTCYHRCRRVRAQPACRQAGPRLKERRL